MLVAPDADLYQTALRGHLHDVEAELDAFPIVAEADGTRQGVREVHGADGAGDGGTVLPGFLGINFEFEFIFLK